MCWRVFLRNDIFVQLSLMPFVIVKACLKVNLRSNVRVALHYGNKVQYIRTGKANEN